MKGTKFAIGLFFLVTGLAMAQDASDVQAALQKAREKQSLPSVSNKPPGKDSAPQTPSPRETTTPTYHPGKSKLYKISELSGLQGQGRLSDSWVYGKFTVLQGGPTAHELIGAVPAGALTGTGVAAVFGVQYKPVLCLIGWLFKDNKMPSIPPQTVIVIPASSPASLEKVDSYNGHVTVAFNMVTPPSTQR